MKVFVINPGSTSTKIALFNDEKCLWSDTQCYEAEQLAQFATVMDQEQFRYDGILKVLEEKGTSPS